MANTNPSPWFNQFIKDKVRLKLQSHGGLLDNTMTTGDRKEGVIKFPFISGESEMFELSGAIQPINVTSRALTTIDVTAKDFQGTEFWRSQDVEKSGASEQDALVKLLAKAQRRKRDTIKLEQFPIFHAAANGAITTIGTGVEVPDLLHFERGRAEMEAFGDDEEEAGQVFCALPAMWASQMKFYKELSNKDFTAPESAPWTMAQRRKMRELQGVTYITLPDSYFQSPTGQPTQLYTWMWHKDALGCEIYNNMEAADLHQRKDLEGRPWQADVFLSGAAVGLRPELVKRFLLQKITAPVRPV
jgi:Phage capsid protein